jgi:hypothetical protein
MKKLAFLTALGFAISAMAQHQTTAGTVDLNVPSFPLWTDTGIALNGGPVTVTYLSGQWSWSGTGELSDANGTGLDADSFDFFYQGPGASHGQLIATVGSNPLTGPFFPIGDGPTTLSGKTGELWLGFNDDAVSNSTGDNQGSIKVQLTTGSGTTLADGGSTLVLLSASLLLAGFVSHRVRGAFSRQT